MITVKALTFLNEGPSTTLPVTEGFYWAKWQRAEQGDKLTAEYESYLPTGVWEVVEVFENALHGPSQLLVLASGVIDAQSLENFMWGPGPLSAPDEISQ